MAISTPIPTPLVNALTSPALSATSLSSYDLVSNRSLSDSIVSQPLHLTADDSDDEIVWSLTSDSIASSADSTTNDDAASSDDEFVVLSQPNSSMASQAGLSTPDEEEGYERYTPIVSTSLEEELNALSLSAKKATKKKVRKAKDVVKSGPSLTASNKERKKKKKNKAATNATIQLASSAYPSPAPSPKAGKKKRSATPTSPVVETSLVAYTGLGSRAIVDDLSDRHSVISCEDESVHSPTLYEEASSFISS
jgi:hypothetical protein